MINQSKIKSQQGMSLIELMIALLIGLLLSAAIITIYISNKKTFWDTEAAASLQENSRFAMKLIANDLRLAGFYGGVDHKVIDKPTDFASTKSCKRATVQTEFEYERPIWVAEGGGDPDPLKLGQEEVGLPTCLTGNDIKGFAGAVGSDVLFVKHVAPVQHEDTDNTDSKKTYIVAALDSAGHFVGTDNKTTIQNIAKSAGKYPDGEIWEYNSYAYFISRPTGVVFPQLKRLKMGSTAWSVETVAEGIEDIYFEFGIDKPDASGKGDGKVDAYVTSVVDWKNVIAVKIYLLAQATRSDNSFNDSKTYKYGDRDYTPADRYHRKLFETTVTLFNNQMEKTRGLSHEK